MIPVKRTLLIERVITQLRQEIASGTFAEELPSCRHLASSLQISVPTLLDALEQLVEEGILLRGKPRRPYRIAEVAASPGAGKDAERTCILLLTAKPLHEFDSNTRAAVDKLIHDSLLQGWELHHRIVAYAGAKKPNPRWDEMIDPIRPTRLVALAGTLVLAEWATAKGIPTIFIGGVPGDTPVTAIGVSTSERLTLVLDRFLDQGHRHICFPICGLQQHLIDLIRTQFQAVLERRGISFVPNYHTPAATIRSPEAMGSLLSQALAVRRPSAIIVMEWLDFVGCVCVFAQHGLIFGRDVAGALLTYDPQIEWYRPRPAHFELPLRRLERTLSDWLRNPAAPRFRKGGLMLEPCVFHEGDVYRSAEPSV